MQNVTIEDNGKYSVDGYLYANLTIFQSKASILKYLNSFVTPALAGVTKIGVQIGVQVSVRPFAFPSTLTLVVL